MGCFDDPNGLFQSVAILRSCIDIGTSYSPLRTVYARNLNVYYGSNGSLGEAILNNGTVVIPNTSVNSSTIVFAFHQIVSGNPGVLTLGTVVSGTSFVINSTSATDDSTIAYLLIGASNGCQ